MPVQFIGWGANGNTIPIATNGGDPGAVSPHSSTATGDLLIWYHYSRATGGNETVSFPGGWNTIYNSVTANQGLVAAAWRIRDAGDSSYDSSITNHTSGTSGESVLQWMETWRGHDATTPIAAFTDSLSTWASSLNIGAIQPPADTSVPIGGALSVFGGRMDNLTTQTTLTGDNLTWAQAGIANTNLGLDAGAVSQYGLNETGSSQTPTAKTITTTGTAQAGAGRMLIINPAAADVLLPQACL